MLNSRRGLGQPIQGFSEHHANALICNLLFILNPERYDVAVVTVLFNRYFRTGHHRRRGHVVQVFAETTAHAQADSLFAAVGSIYGVKRLTTTITAMTDVRRVPCGRHVVPSDPAGNSLFEQTCRPAELYTVYSCRRQRSTSTTQSTCGQRISRNDFSLSQLCIRHADLRPFSPSIILPAFMMNYRRRFEKCVLPGTAVDFLALQYAKKSSSISARCHLLLDI